jgi:hypothetical protein
MYFFLILSLNKKMKKISTKTIIFIIVGIAIIYLAIAKMAGMYPFGEEHFKLVGNESDFLVLSNKLDNSFCVHGTGAPRGAGVSFANISFHAEDCGSLKTQFRIRPDGKLEHRSGRLVYAERREKDGQLKLSDENGKRQDGKPVEDKFRLNSNGTIDLLRNDNSRSGYCIHPYGGYARNDKHLVLYSDCSKKEGDRIKFIARSPKDQEFKKRGDKDCTNQDGAIPVYKWSLTKGTYIECVTV